MSVKDPICWEDFIRMVESMPLSVLDYCTLLGYDSVIDLRRDIDTQMLSVWHINGVLAAAFPIASSVGWRAAIEQWPTIRELVLHKFKTPLPQEASEYLVGLLKDAPCEQLT